MKKFIIGAKDGEECCCHHVSNWYVNQVSPLSMTDELSEALVFSGVAEVKKIIGKVKKAIEADKEDRFTDLVPEAEDYDEEAFGEPEKNLIYKRQREAAYKAWDSIRARG